ncbi:MAG TPA: hypothetical protein VHO50_07810, partial [Bacteroidales bacterium]|nr:hypothetical protein [Bacteroidales bacterium]
NSNCFRSSAAEFLFLSSPSQALPERRTAQKQKSNERPAHWKQLELQGSPKGITADRREAVIPLNRSNQVLPV